MHFIFASLAALIVGSVVSVTAQTCTTCGSIMQQFWRSNLPGKLDHFYTTDNTQFLTAVNSQGYKPEGVAGGVFSTQLGSSVAFFGLFNSALVDHFYTTNATEVKEFEANGYVLQGTAAFVYPRQVCGSVPLYRTFNPTAVDHFYTTNPLERDASLSSYVDQGIAAYLPAPGATNNSPLC
ncbi:hypothetical protein GGX14DRAFT_580547 [Mycena pura]|uniref:DUF5648 domain-containing protein n=1 Tax=Mycena pura TaxID=153505 RepID=A0AAD6ULC6_9AGAR|nr:hypothetical protein GGX14DRAFT_580547 [Mycena pura]